MHAIKVSDCDHGTVRKILIKVIGTEIGQHRV
jgi:hypothetical protein